MKFEIERKYLVDLNQWLQTEKPAGEFYRQGYIVKGPAKTVRVRLTDSSAFLTIKGAVEGISRPEFEYEIPQIEAKELLDRFCNSEISKTRYKIEHEGKIWEVDAFHGDNEGLLLAEIELSSETEEFTLPAWIIEEVSGDVRYYNSSLISNPYKNWAK